MDLMDFSGDEYNHLTDTVQQTTITRAERLKIKQLIEKQVNELVNKRKEEMANYPLLQPLIQSVTDNTTPQST